MAQAAEAGKARQDSKVVGAWVSPPSSMVGVSSPEQRGTSAPGLQRVLGPLDATCIVVGAIVGVGIFFNPTDVARLAGSGGLALVAWAVGGAIAISGVSRRATAVRGR